MVYRHFLLPYSPFRLDGPSASRRSLDSTAPPTIGQGADDRRHARAYEKRQAVTAGAGAAVPIAPIAADCGEATPDQPLFVHMNWHGLGQDSQIAGVWSLATHGSTFLSWCIQGGCGRARRQAMYAPRRARLLTSL